MDFERINEDTIRVMMTPEDLSDYDVVVMDLLESQEKMERFFYSVLEDVDTEHDFMDNEAVTFQILPSGQGLELFISKNLEDPTGMQKAVAKALDKTEGIEPDDDVKEELLNRLLGFDDATPDDDERQTKLEADTVDTQIQVEFANFEDVLNFAQMQPKLYADEQLFRYQDKYYLVMTFDESHDMATIKDSTAIAREYGTVSPVSADVLLEHGEQIFKRDATEQIRHYFD